MTVSDILYDQFAPHYRQYAKKRANYLSSVNNIIIADSKRILPISKMLDVGSGEGQRASYLKKVIGAKTLLMMESSQEMLVLCKPQTGEKIIKADITKFENNKYVSKFDIVTCLWNVFGHIDSKNKRITALRQIRKMLSKNGRIYIDISNRYNVKYYGLKIVLKNIFLDLILPNRLYGKNGDFKYNIQLSKHKQITSSCHFFNKFEFDNLIKIAGLSIENAYYIDYLNGNVELTQFSGHILYVLKRNNS